MRVIVSKFFVLAALASLVGFTTGCGKMQKKPSVTVNRGAEGAGGEWGYQGDGTGTDGEGAPGARSWGAEGSSWSGGEGGMHAEGVGGEELPEGQAVPELPEVYFALDQSEIDPAATAQLDRNAAYLNQNTGIHVVLRGHCDDRGTEEYNMALGSRRAQTVRDYLIGKGIAAERLHTMSFGESMPRVEGTDDASRAQNRRVEFFTFMME